jgi:hypothetical protein
MQPITPMTLTNMRANGVRTLAARCLGRRYTWPASSGVGSEDCVEPDEPGGDGGRSCAPSRPAMNSRSPIMECTPCALARRHDGELFIHAMRWIRDLPTPRQAPALAK